MRHKESGLLKMPGYDALNDLFHLLDPTAYAHGPVAMIPATGEKEDCEVSDARALLVDPQVRLENALVTADPLHNKQNTVRVIAEKGGDYLIGTKDNTPKRHQAVVNALQATPFLP